MGFWGGFIQAAGEKAHQENLLDIQSEMDRRKQFMDHVLKLSQDPTMRPEAQQRATELYQTLVSTPWNKKVKYDLGSIFQGTPVSTGQPAAGQQIKYPGPPTTEGGPAEPSGSFLSAARPVAGEPGVGGMLPARYTPHEEALMAAESAGLKAGAVAQAEEPSKINIAMQTAFARNYGKPEKLTIRKGAELIARGVTQTSGGIPIDPIKEYGEQTYYYNSKPDDIFEKGDPKYQIRTVVRTDPVTGEVYSEDVAIIGTSATPISGTTGLAQPGYYPRTTGAVQLQDPNEPGRVTTTTTSQRALPTGKLTSGIPTQYAPKGPTPQPKTVVPGAAPEAGGPSAGATAQPTTAAPKIPPPPGTPAAAPATAKAANAPTAQTPPVRESQALPGYEDINNAVGMDLLKSMSPEEARNTFRAMVNSYPSQWYADKIDQIKLSPQSEGSRENIKEAIRQLLDSPNLINDDSYRGKPGLVIKNAMRSVGIPIPAKVSAQDSDKAAFAFVTLKGLDALEQILLSNPNLIGMIRGRWNQALQKIGTNMTLSNVDAAMAQEISTRMQYFLVMEAKVLMGARPALAWAERLAKTSPDPHMTIQQVVGALKAARDHAYNNIREAGHARWGDRWLAMMPSFNSPFMPGAPQPGWRRINPKTGNYEVAVTDPDTNDLWWVLPKQGQQLNGGEGTPIEKIRTGGKVR